MKYIIRESRLGGLVSEYIDSLLSKPNSSILDTFIVIYDDDTPDEYGITLLEFDTYDGRLWIADELLYRMKHYFGLPAEKSVELLKKKFEDRFEVKILYLQYPNKTIRYD